jgi:hypothetical protein
MAIDQTLDENNFKTRGHGEVTGCTLRIERLMTGDMKKKSSGRGLKRTKKLRDFNQLMGSNAGWWFQT